MNSSEQGLKYKRILKKFSPNIALFQEIKTEDKTYPYEEIKSLGYESYVLDKKVIELQYYLKKN